MYINFLPPNMSLLHSLPYGKINASLPPRKACPAHRSGFELLSQPTYSIHSCLHESLFPEMSGILHNSSDAQAYGLEAEKMNKYTVHHLDKRENAFCPKMNEKIRVSSWTQMEEI